MSSKDKDKKKEKEEKRKSDKKDKKDKVDKKKDKDSKNKDKDKEEEEQDVFTADFDKVRNQRKRTAPRTAARRRRCSLSQYSDVFCLLISYSLRSRICSRSSA